VGEPAPGDAPSERHRAGLVLEFGVVVGGRDQRPLAALRRRRRFPCRASRSPCRSGVGRARRWCGSAGGRGWRPLGWVRSRCSRRSRGCGRQTGCDERGVLGSARRGRGFACPGGLQDVADRRAVRGLVADEQAVGVDWLAGVGLVPAERQCGRRGLPVGDRESAMPGPRFGRQCTGSRGRGAVLFGARGSGIVAAPEGGMIGPALVVGGRRGAVTQLFSTSTWIGGLVRTRWLLSRERPSVGRRA
jgi:hypothetical protein